MLLSKKQRKIMGLIIALASIALIISSLLPALTLLA
jgi:hypothetical protein